MSCVRPWTVVSVSPDSRRVFQWCAIAPILGAVASGIGGAHLIPIVAAVVIALALAAFQVGHLKRRDA